MSLHSLVWRKIAPLRIFYGQIRLSIHAWKETQTFKRLLSLYCNHKKVFYLGITEHNNLGDNAQYYCIDQWIKRHFSDYKIIYTDATTIIDKYAKWIRILKKHFNINNDIIVFQSGYCTQDLGGTHEEMHRLIADQLPNAPILMMPQTIFFRDEKNKKRTSKSYDQCHQMLFLSRDKLSFDMAREMFTHIKVELYPDIVTTLIGKFNINREREKIFLCHRNDGEKFYSEDELDNLCQKMELLAPVDKGDTQYKGKHLKQNLEKAIYEVIEQMGQYKVVVTDRYHGTIFALCANTPVVIIKTNDHKVTTGADWFRGVYDKHVYVASSLEDAYCKVQNICSDFDYYSLKPYFETEYYDKLKELFLQKR